MKLPCQSGRQTNGTKKERRRKSKEMLPVRWLQVVKFLLHISNYICYNKFIHIRSLAAGCGWHCTIRHYIICKVLKGEQTNGKQKEPGERFLLCHAVLGMGRRGSKGSVEDFKSSVEKLWKQYEDMQKAAKKAWQEQCTEALLGDFGEAYCL